MTAALAAAGLTVRYGETVALDGVTLQLAAGRLHALVGENGAGKTTLLKCFAGLLRPHAGSVLHEAACGRIGMLRQDAGLIDGMSVLHNLSLAHARQQRLQWDSFRQRASAALQDQEAEVDLDADAESLSYGERQKVAIARMQLSGCGIVLLDEPTAALNPAEAHGMLERMRKHVRAGGTAVVASHRLEETLEHADEIHVLTQGRLVLTRAKEGLDVDAVRGAMFPAAVPAYAAAVPRTKSDEVALELQDLRLPGCEGSISLRVRRGETVGIAGIAGNGQADLMEILAGLRKPAGGSVRVAGRSLAAGKGVAMGLRCIMENLRRDAAMPFMSIGENLILHDYARAPYVHRFGMLAKDFIARHARTVADDEALGVVDPALPFVSLSGGNQRKLVAHRELASVPVAVAAHNPTAGLDAAAVASVAAALRRCCAQGAGVLLCSEDLAMLGSCASRLLVIKRGTLVPIVDSAQRLAAAAAAMAS